MPSGEVMEVRYNPKAVALQVRIETPGALKDIAAIVSTDDQERHAICLSTAGALHRNSILASKK